MSSVSLVNNTVFAVDIRSAIKQSISCLVDGEKLPQVDLSVAVLVELLERLRDEDGRAPLRTDLREDEVLELVLRQNLQSYSR